MSRRRKKRLPVDPVAASIESLSHEGRGITHIDGKTIFIDGALPGEDLMFIYTSRRAKYDEGRAVEILNPSVDRIQPECVHFGICGGCSLQHMSADAQLAHKQNVLIEQFRHVAQLEIDNILAPLVSESWGYRRKARLGVRFVIKKDKLLVGFRERNSGYLTDMQSCPVLHESVGQRIELLQTTIRRLEAYQRIAQIEVAVGDAVTVLVFRNLDELSDADKDILIDFSRETGLHVWLQPGGPESASALWPAESQLSYTLPDYDVELYFLPTDFTQVNADINKQMLKHALCLLDLHKDNHVLDLFCGIGNFSLSIARQVAQVTGIEGSDALVARAKDNAVRNNIENVEYLVADLASVMPASVGKVDRLLLDPPRTGALEVVENIKTIDPERIVYVSCNISTLARDAGELVHKQGYRLVSAGIMDMFPHTAHVESIAVFARK